MTRSRFVGLDVGISTTDAVGDWAPDHPVSLPTAEVVETAVEALRRLLAAAPPPDDGPLVVAATGVGSHRLPGTVGSLPLRRVPEIEAIGRGGLVLAGLEAALVVSLGTGTTLVSARAGELRHIVPGTGVGGGTLVAFARALVGTADLGAFAELAAQGDRTRVDLTIGEVAGGPLGGLPPEATASNLGKWSPETARHDLAAGLANLVAEVAIELALLGLQISSQTRVVFVGKLPTLAPLRQRLAEVSSSLGDLFVIPAGGGTATALGAVEAARSGALA